MRIRLSETVTKSVLDASKVILEETYNSYSHRFQVTLSPQSFTFFTNFDVLSLKT